ncbi:alcohol dehydrogenase [Streptomyces tateyamensis]|uniref:Alcohol dehydrogenase n=1 Tax=Streptomyces tateyamensis TaxID=565073 RepID=A0A2V4NMP4_9ACTN|nr:NADP-dependent oxidoreductase [Streptomyces tateyamensis]PYC83792.1 alcohol dehydrogenase [Streptomyces tateyamensis]
MVQAVVFERYGGAEVLQLAELPEPVAGQGEVRVRVRAAGVNPIDCKIRRGEFSGGQPAAGLRTLGNEFAGVVDAVGPGVTDFAVGDEVIGFASANAYTESLAVPADQLTAKPAALGWEPAGALSAVGQTAHNSLEELKVAAGETLLVHAAAGGVGTVAVQLAVQRGATVIGTASERNHAYLRSLGAVPVSYGPGLEERVRELAPGGVDAAFDCIGGEAIAVSVALVEERDRIGTIVDQQLAEQFGVRRLRGVRSAATLRMIAEQVADGRLVIPIAAAYPLAEAAAAHREVETGHVRGKVVLTVG